MAQSHLPSASTEETPGAMTPEELEMHRGHWLAFRADGQLVASCATLKELEARLRAAGEDLEEVLFDRIPDGDAIFSGAELS